MTPFEYPAQPLKRRHGPTGYLDLASFRPWLRDEFIFRCAYCLRRENWEPRQTGFEIDHLVPIVDAPELAFDYDNLLYSCSTCNSVKSARDVPNPGDEMLASGLTVLEDGRIVGHTSGALHTIWVLGLDDSEFTNFRARWIKIVALAKQHDPDLYRRLLGFPDDLPDVSSLKPPGGNTRPEGIDRSYFQQRERGELPEIY